jgi:galactonate dehydratase
LVRIDCDGALQGDKIVTDLAQHVNGFIPIPGAPGIGVELVEDAEKRFPYKPKPVEMRAHLDGSFVDQ